VILYCCMGWATITCCLDATTLAAAKHAVLYALASAVALLLTQTYGQSDLAEAPMRNTGDLSRKKANASGQAALAVIETQWTITCSVVL